MFNFEQADLPRQLANLIVLGLIHDVDHENQKVKVVVGDNFTNWLPWPADVGANYTRWRPLQVGTQVAMASTDGDFNNGVIVQTLYTENLPAPSSNPKLDLIQFNDGTTISYNSDNKTLLIDSVGIISINATGNISVSSDADMTIKAAGQLTLEASQIDIKGPVTQTRGDMTSDGISAQSHDHGGVKAGGDKSGGPS
jgi:phage baseplate assembly protein V